MLLLLFIFTYFFEFSFFKREEIFFFPHKNPSIDFFLIHFGIENNFCFYIVIIIILKK